MSKAKFTPGPWYQREEQDGELLPDGTGYAGDWYPGTTVMASDDDGDEWIADFRYEADARLGAAAPTMLDALKSIAAQCSGYERDGLGATIMGVGDFARSVVAEVEED